MRQIIVVLGLLSLAACQSSDDSAHNHDHEANFDTTSWPPSLNNIQNQQALPPVATVRARQSLVGAARSAVMNNPAVREAVGDHPREFEASLGGTKGNATAHFLFFRYDTNETVEVTLLRSGNVTINTFAANEYQPAENPEEVDSAIQLARIALESGGFNTSGLNSTAMMTHPTATTMDSPDQAYYAERIFYVTFGPGEGELPVYSARVNLSDNTVADFGPIR